MSQECTLGLLLILICHVHLQVEALQEQAADVEMAHARCEAAELARERALQVSIGGGSAGASFFYKACPRQQERGVASLLWTSSSSWLAGSE
jgi:hypothetical protein